jgi:predicted enzyme related to lactoylglutathione lyase
MKIKLDTIILFVRDVDKLKKFYAEIFKFEIVEELKAEWVLLSTGNCHIGFHKIGKEYLYKSDSDIKFESNLKIVFEVDNICNLREELLFQNVRIKEIKTFDNYNFWLCDGEDPEGNVFQLKQKK